MTYDRMQAKLISGQHCRFCGDPSVPLVKTRCCEEWICCDTAETSHRGGGFCQFEHEHYSKCHFHYQEKHHGAWQECQECADFWEEQYGKYPPGIRNEPKYDEPRDASIAKMHREMFNGT